jgi:hypothetical protein
MTHYGLGLKLPHQSGVKSHQSEVTFIRFFHEQEGDKRD